MENEDVTGSFNRLSANLYKMAAMIGAGIAEGWCVTPGLSLASPKPIPFPDYRTRVDVFREYSIEVELSYQNTTQAKNAQHAE